MSVAPANMFLRDVEHYFGSVASSILGIPCHAEFQRHSFMDRRVTVTAPGGVFFEFTFVSFPSLPASIKTISEPFRTAVYEAQQGVH